MKQIISIIIITFTVALGCTYAQERLFFADKTYESITKGNCALEASTPESFNVLVKELRAACLDVRTEKK